MKKFLFLAFKPFLFLALFAFSISGSAVAQTKIQFWHAFGSGPNAEMLNNFAKEFNKNNKDYDVIATYKGDYEQTLTAGIAGIRTKTHPDLLMVYDAGTATMVGKKEVAYPLYELFEDAKVKFDVDDLNPGVKNFYVTNDGKLLSYPFNASTPILFYNRDLFKKAGLSDNTPLKTWDDITKAAEKLKGVSKSPIILSWTMWGQLENFAAIHNVAYASKDNGYGGFRGVELMPDPKPFITQWAMLKDLSDRGLYVYKGRNNIAESAFSSGEAAILITSSAAAPRYDLEGINYGVGYLPLNTKVAKSFQNSIIGGASLWALRGHSAKRAKGTALFLAFLASKEKQKEWATNTGYVPVTMTAYRELKAEGLYKKFPNKELAVKQLSDNTPTKNSRGYRLGFNPQIRTVAYEEFEAMLNGKITPEKAISNLQKKANNLLKRFGRTVK